MAVNSSHFFSPPESPLEAMHRPQQIMLRNIRILGAFYATMVPITAMLTVVTVTGIKYHGRWRYALWAGMFALICWLDLPYFWRVWTATAKGRLPVALNAAAPEPARLVVLRPLLALWWCCHFVLGLLNALMFEALDPLRDMEREHPFMIAFVWIVMSFWYTYAANLFLVQAAAVSMGQNLVKRVWRYHTVVDIGLIVLGMALVLKWRR